MPASLGSLIDGAKGTQKRDIKRALEMMKQLEG